MVLFSGPSLPQSPVTGDIVYYNGTQWATLAVGTAGQVLNITGGIPTYVNIALAQLPTGTGILKATGSTPTYVTPLATTDLPSGTGILKGTGGSPSYVTPLLKADIPAVTAFTDAANNFTADQSIAGNKIKTTTFQISEGSAGSAGNTNGMLFQPITGNTNQSCSVAPLGTARTAFFTASRTSDLTTNYEVLNIGASDILNVGEFIINVRNAGTGSLRPLIIYMFNTKLLSFDTGNTVTSYNDFLQTTGKKLGLNVGLTSYIWETGGVLQLVSNNVVITLPVATATLATLGANTFTGVQTTNGRIRKFPGALSSDYTVVATDEIILEDATGAVRTVTLPLASNGKQQITIIKKDGSVNAVTVSANAADTIQGSATKSLTVQYSKITLVSDGGNTWYDLVGQLV